MIKSLVIAAVGFLIGYNWTTVKTWIQSIYKEVKDEAVKEVEKETKKGK